jgi:hypothetical protein
MTGYFVAHDVLAEMATGRENKRMKTPTANLLIIETPL